MAFSLFHNKASSLEAELLRQQATTAESSQAKTGTKPIVVHTMPEKFVAVKTKTGGFKRRIVIGIILIVVIGGGMGLAAWFFVRSINSPIEDREKIARHNPPPSPAPPAPVTHPPEPPPSLPPKPPEPPTPPTTTEEIEFSQPTTTDVEVALEPTSTNEIVPPPPPPPPQPLRQALPNSRDTDGDELTDLEEEIWGTDPKRPDSDGDGYLDGKEVVALYSPTQGGGVKLEVSSQVRTYLNPQLNYTVLVPATWDNRLLDPTSATQVVFTAPTGEFFAIIAQENFEGWSDPKDWYLSEYPSVSPGLLYPVTTPAHEWIVSPDGLTAYLIVGGYLYSISYNPGIRESLNYLTTYKMVVQSFSTFVKP